MVAHNTFVLMHDVAPCHRSKAVSEYFLRSKVEILDWPEYTPDLNPIKKWWSYIKNKAAEKQRYTAKELVSAIKEVWVKEISTDYCTSLVKCMPSRLAAVVREKGGQTKY